jgi:5-methyltetrahydrofolate--homocysteine methyltransferase
VLDGATGTMLQSYELTAADFGGPELEGCNEHLCVTRPDVVRGVSPAYLAAGADIVETNTFGATPLVLAEYGLAERAFELNRRAASAGAPAPATGSRRRGGCASSPARWGRRRRRSRSPAASPSRSSWGTSASRRSA